MDAQCESKPAISQKRVRDKIEINAKRLRDQSIGVIDNARSYESEGQMQGSFTSYEYK